MDTTEDTKKEDLTIPKPNTGAALIENHYSAAKKVAFQSTPSILTRTQSSVIPAGYIRDRSGQLIPIPNTSTTGKGSVKPSVGTSHPKSSLTNGTVSSSTAGSPNTTPIIQPVASVANPTDETIQVLKTSSSSSSSSSTKTSIGNEKDSESFQTSLPGKSVTISEELLKSLLAKQNSPGLTGEQKNSQTSSIPQQPQPLTTVQQPLSVPQFLGQSQHLPQINKRQRSCPPDTLAHPLRVSSVAKGLRNAHLGAHVEEMDAVRSDGDEDSGDDLDDLEEEPDPMAIAIDEKVTALVASNADLVAGLRAVHQKLDMLAGYLSRFAQSQQKP